MPELAEVQTLVDQLQDHLAGSTIQSFQVHHQPLLQVGNPGSIAGLELKAIERWGKRLRFVCGDSPYWLIASLGMTGGWLLGNKPEKYLIAELHTSKGIAWYVDPRKFSRFHLFSSPESAQETLGARIGTDAIAELNDQELQVALGSSGVKLKAALLDQSRLAGIGNYLADEINWEAKLSPMRPLNQLSPENWNDLNQARVLIINRALKAQGLSFSNYRHADGAEGEMIGYLCAYGRAGLSCHRCKSILQKSVVAGRGTHWCSQCQL